MTRFLTFLACLISLSGCTVDHKLDLSKVSSITLVQSGTNTDFAKGSDEYKKTISWLAENKVGWDRYFATAYQGNILIRSNMFTLNILNDTVILNYSLNGDYEQLIKKVNESDFKYLQR